MSTYTDITIPEKTARILLLLGLARDEGEYITLTDKGDAWLREWCEARIKAHEGRS